jgi:hypothetical protein
MNGLDEEKGSLAELLGRVGDELASAAREVDDLHALVECATAGDMQSDVFIRRVQTIDLLQQHLEALSSFMGELAKSLPAAWAVGGEVADGVKLSRLRERLISANLSENDDDGAAGDLFVF